MNKITCLRMRSIRWNQCSVKTILSIDSLACHLCWEWGPVVEEPFSMWGTSARQKNDGKFL